MSRLIVGVGSKRVRDGLGWIGAGIYINHRLQEDVYARRNRYKKVARLTALKLSLESENCKSKFCNNDIRNV